MFGEAVSISTQQEANPKSCEIFDCEVRLVWYSQVYSSWSSGWPYKLIDGRALVEDIFSSVHPMQLRRSRGSCEIVKPLLARCMNLCIPTFSKSMTTKMLDGGRFEADVLKNLIIKHFPCWWSSTKYGNEGTSDFVIVAGPCSHTLSRPRKARLILEWNSDVRGKDDALGMQWENKSSQRQPSGLEGVFGDFLTLRLRI